MYFSNLMDEAGVGLFRRSSGYGVIPFESDVSDRTAEKRVLLGEGKLYVDSDGDDVFMKGLDSDTSEEFLPGFKTGLTCREVADTEENPLIVVFAKSIKFYSGVKTLVKYVNMGNDSVLVMLVYGACEYTFPDGTAVAIQRCSDAVLDGREVREFSPSELRDAGRLVDVESGYNMAYDCVNALLVNISAGSSSYRVVKDLVRVFSDSGLKRERERVAEHKRRMEELARQKAEERKAREEADRVRREKEKELKELEESEKSSKRNSRVKKSTEEVFESSSAGAAAFLDAVSKL